ncbi:Type II secretion system protein E [Zhongshania aliphaticivorans]|uniref:Type II secretion system protein E n=1 Tax=Zhongshania aliphaticivorans TaxID=1470434 RepID=A0A5S9QAU2_9GAMM|nr:type II secretion system ATPase GspE [Zhongshania aliphaticivorans]CAA0087219.1 Type II secretion system protein E [Zhongshania aliphaticivorans]CAA0114320.1 Type II secretion system protein E [Zhongshania aliphaticivorans]
MSQPLSYAFARSNRVLVEEVGANSFDILCCKETPASAVAEVQRVLHGQVKLTLCDEAILQEKINETFQRQQGDAMSAMGDISNEVDLDRLAEEIPESQDLLDAQDDAPVIRLINALFGEALKRDASDIHIETYEKTMSVRLRVDGILQEVLTPSRRLAPLLVSRIKVMSRLDIAEKRVPQDGRVSLRIAGRSVDVRVSTIPSNYGERVVMRLLDKQAARIDINQLGMPDKTLSTLKDLLQQPNGILLVTGPTGSGKTTTLYAGLMSLNDRRRNILTVEDPVEYDIDGIGQTQVHAKVGMTFARGLRAILRQDPDVVMLGEVRDKETAEIAVQASLTGHMVLSTLHTNTAVGAVTRLVDIGVEPYLIASSLKGVLAQRLVRKLCQQCRHEIVLDKTEARLLGDPKLEGSKAFNATGCDDCQHTGYKGRQGVYELLVIDREVAELIHNRASEHDILRQVGSDMPSLMGEGRRLVLSGQTSVDELLRSVREGGDAGL